MIRLSQVSKVYGDGPARVEALRSVDLHIAPGEFVSIMGPSGSGKSTLLNLVSALDVPSSGVITIDPPKPVTPRTTPATAAIAIAAIRERVTTSSMAAKKKDVRPTTSSRFPRSGCAHARGPRGSRDAARAP